MPLHPAAPEDLPGLVEAYAQTTRAVVDLGRSCSEAEFTLQTECPGWTVKTRSPTSPASSRCSRATATPRWTLPAYDHLSNELSHLTERAVEVRRCTAPTRTSSPSSSTSSGSGCPACAAPA